MTVPDMTRWRNASMQIDRNRQKRPDDATDGYGPFSRIPLPWVPIGSGYRCDWCGRKPAWHFDAVPVLEANMPEEQRMRPTDSPDRVSTMPMNVCNRCLPKVVHWKFDWDQTMERHGPTFLRNIWRPCKLQPIPRKKMKDEKERF